MRSSNLTRKPCSFRREVNSHSALAALSRRALLARGKISPLGGLPPPALPRAAEPRGQCHQSARLPDSARRPAFPSGPLGTRVAILKRKEGREKKTSLSVKSLTALVTAPLSVHFCNGPGDPRPTPQRPLLLSLAAFASLFLHFLRGFRGFCSSKSCPLAKLTLSAALYLPFSSLSPSGPDSSDEALKGNKTFASLPTPL